ncbi:MAG: YeeE/YedE family protein [Pseudomonadota bacterium]
MNWGKRNAAAFIAGLIFGVGLSLSQMVNPAKVLGFLDVFGAWDPTLVFVMGGAVITTLVGFRFVLPRGKPVLTDRFSLPKQVGIDRSLVGGAVLFGIGWGLAGFCPGPAITALGALSSEALVFVSAMVLGLLVGKAIKSANWGRDPQTA